MSIPMGKVAGVTGVVVIDNNDLMSLFHQPVRQMRSNKAGATGDENAFAFMGRQRRNLGV